MEIDDRVLGQIWNEVEQQYWELCRSAVNGTSISYGDIWLKLAKPIRVEVWVECCQHVMRQLDEHSR